MTTLQIINFANQIKDRLGYESVKPRVDLDFDIVAYINPTTGEIEVFGNSHIFMIASSYPDMFPPPELNFYFSVPDSPSSLGRQFFCADSALLCMRLSEPFPTDIGLAEYIQRNFIHQPIEYLK
jgi:hypothetical protein